MLPSAATLTIDPVALSRTPFTAQRQAAILAAGLGSCLVLAGIGIHTSSAVSALLAISVLLVWAAACPDSGNHALKVAGAVVFFVAFWCSNGLYLGWLNALFPVKYDPVLLGLEVRWHLPLSLWAARQSRSYPLVAMIAQVVYFSLEYVMAAYYGWHLLAGRTGKARKLMLAYVAAFAIGPMLYPLLPACGPAYAFPGYPDHHVQTGVAMIWAGRPNCAPSLHMTAAVLLLLFRLPGRGPICFTALFALGTAFATLATGEHYAIDLVLAIPFAGFVWGLIERKWTLAGCLLGVVSALMLSIRLAG